MLIPQQRFVIGLMTLTLAATTMTDAGSVFYVSTSGADTNSGTVDAPFASPIGARDAIRGLRKTGKLGAGPVTVRIEHGVYLFTRTLVLSEQDSGTADAPVVWEAAEDATVRFVGGTRLVGWKPVSDPKVLKRLPPAARSHVRQVNLVSLGVKDFGGVAPGPKRAELFFDHRYMTLARYPNEGKWLRINGIPKGAARARPVSKANRPDLNRYEGPFIYDDDRPARWQLGEDVWMHGYWFHDWSDQYHQVLKFDLAEKKVWPKPPYHGYGYKKGQRFYFLNVLEELDRPGEWRLDRESGVLYLWPPAALDDAEVMFPELKVPMLTLDHAQHVSVRGVTFECSRNSAILIRGGSHNEIAGCVVRNVGGAAIQIDGGTHHTVRSCDVYEVASTGISVKGGDRKTLTRGDHVVENCHIHDFAKVFKTYRPGVSLNGVGNRVSHCFIHDCPHEGIGYSGNDHVIEYCEFTRIARETGDVGCIYSAMDWSYMGHVFRFNYFHSIHGPGRLGCFTVYPDLPCGGIHLYGNVFYDVDQGFLTNSGRGMVIENNLFLRCRKTIQFNVWMDPKKFRKGGNWRMVERLEAIHYNRPPYSTRYPVLARLAEDFAQGEAHALERALPKDNVIRRNVSWGGHFLHLGAKAGFQHVTVERNVIADDIVFTGSPTGNGESRQYANNDETIRALLAKTGNVILDRDPGLDDLRTQDFALVPNSPAWKLGFRRIPFEEIGLVVDTYRTSLPLEVYEPTIIPPARRFIRPITVRLIPTPAPGGRKCVIRYTLDGSEPTVSSTAYSSPLAIAKSATVKAAAFTIREGRTKRSATATTAYTRLSLGKGGVYLSDLQESDLVVYRPCWKKDRNHYGGPIKLGGQEFPKGILLHPTETKRGNLGTVTYVFPGELGRIKRFTAIIGIDDAMHRYNKGSATFIVEVHRNGKWERVFASGVLKLGDKPRDVSVDITGADRLRLTTTDAGDGIACDHAEWADAKVF